MFTKVLIANRGEIAVRIIRACREMGLRSVAAFSDADATSPHVWLADEAVNIGPPEAARSYLDIGRLIDAARKTGAQAIHPGYGFLAESAGFATACRDAGITFVGPPPDVIAALGDKARARKLADVVGVPVVPGFNDPRADDDTITREAKAIGFPLVLKAAAGAGGRGLRVVERAEDLEVAIGSARREARAAFGADGLIIERWIEHARHIEVQVLADQHGGAVHLGERECSIQRRYQKVIEESPSSGADTRLRAELADAATRIAHATDYVNAGTVEFLVDRDRRYYFLEVNTRLQVEHPVTEMVMGVDLVQAQFRVAAGNRLHLRQRDLRSHGWAIECRVYAEDPEADFAPSPGKVLHLIEPHMPGVRVDSGVVTGQEIPRHYDPILSKVIAWAPDRAGALHRMRQALHDYVVLGIRTNLSYLRAVLDLPALAAGDLSTDFLSVHLPHWQHPAPTSEAVAIAALLSESDRPQTGAPAPPNDRPSTNFADPWERLSRWRI
ncbi:MAG TPA: biotin carboxylase N-terminal domain-containing protein [bacterium]|nr:biotin carboxylase N-terminal domain-containing protein [bacterium]